MRISVQQFAESFITIETKDLHPATRSACTIVEENDRAGQPEQQLNT